MTPNTEPMEIQVKDSTDLANAINPEMMDFKLARIIRKQTRHNKSASKLIKTHPYFQDDNFESAIIKMANSGLGRKGKRQLAKNMMITWKMYKEMEKTIFEYNPDAFGSAAQKAMM